MLVTESLEGVASELFRRALTLASSPHLGIGVKYRLTAAISYHAILIFVSCFGYPNQYLRRSLVFA